MVSYRQALRFARDHPQRDDDSWAGWCESLAWRITGVGASNAISAFEASGDVVSTEPDEAPPGAWHWWDMGADGHVAMATRPGRALMASSSVREPWGQAMGITSMADYNRAHGGYLGWTFDHCGVEVENDSTGVSQKAELEPRPLTEEEELMAVMVPIIEDDGSISSWQPIHMVLAEILHNSRQSTPRAHREAVFTDAALKQQDGTLQPVSMGLLAVHTRAVLNDISKKVGG